MNEPVKNAAIQTQNAKELSESLAQAIAQARAQSPTAGQSIPNGAIVRFDLKDNSPNDFDDEACIAANWNGREALVESLATFAELGEKDHEYYNIHFLPCDSLTPSMTGVSGYNLTIINDGTDREQI